MSTSASGTATIGAKHSSEMMLLCWPKAGFRAFAGKYMARGALVSSFLYISNTVRRGKIPQILALVVAFVGLFFP